MRVSNGASQNQSLRSDNKKKSSIGLRCRIFVRSLNSSSSGGREALGLSHGAGLPFLSRGREPRIAGMFWFVSLSSFWST